MIRRLLGGPEANRGFASAPTGTDTTSQSECLPPSRVAVRDSVVNPRFRDHLPKPIHSLVGHAGVVQRNNLQIFQSLEVAQAGVSHFSPVQKQEFEFVESFQLPVRRR